MCTTITGKYKCFWSSFFFVTCILMPLFRLQKMRSWSKLITNNKSRDLMHENVGILTYLKVPCLCSNGRMDRKHKEIYRSNNNVWINGYINNNYYCCYHYNKRNSNRIPCKYITFYYANHCLITEYWFYCFLGVPCLKWIIYSLDMEVQQT